MFRLNFGRSALFAVFTGALALSATQTAIADGNRQVSLRFAGDFIQNIEQTVTDPFGQPIGTSTVGLVRAKAKGRPGNADTTAVTKAQPVAMPVPDDRCPEGFLKVEDITDNNLVLTFSDLSLLYGDGQGVVCINFANGEQYAAVEGTWLGGTGRFRDAGGEFSIRFDELALVSPNTRFFAEAGTITGTLEFGP